MRRRLGGDCQSPGPGRATKSTGPAVDRCRKWTRPPVSPARAMSRATTARFGPRPAGRGCPTRLALSPSFMSPPRARCGVLVVLGQAGAGQRPGVSSARRMEAGVGHAGAVVGEDADAEAVQFAEGGELLAGRPSVMQGRRVHDAEAPPARSRSTCSTTPPCRSGGWCWAWPPERCNRRRPGPGAGLDGLGVLAAGFRRWVWRSTKPGETTAPSRRGRWRRPGGADLVADFGDQPVHHEDVVPA